MAPTGRPAEARPLPLFTRHIHGLKKDWSITPTRPILILGDSNLNRLPAVLSGDVQVDCYPGAKIKHATVIINSVAVPNLQVRCLILSFGLNNHGSPPAYSHPEADVMLRRARATFPRASVLVPLIDPGLPRQERDNITLLNRFLAANSPVIPLLPAASFNTLLDNIHWTASTARAVLAHWTPFF